MSYLALLRAVSPWFFVLGFLARLPYAMSPLATLVLFTAATGSIAFAGLASAVQSVAIALAGPLVGFLADRWRLTGAVLPVANAFALVGMLAVTDGWLMVVTAGLAGLTQPQVGPLVRVWWGRSRRSLLPTALSYEAAADDTVFVVGPAVVGLLAFLGPAVPVLASVVLLVGAALPFGWIYGMEPASRVRVGSLPVVAMARLFAGMVMIGGVFGAIQVGVTAADPLAAGLLYAELGAGSALAGLACAWLPARFGLVWRHRVFAVALAAGCVALVVVRPLPLAIALASVTVAPYMITLYALTDRLAPTSFAMTILCAAGPLGTAATRALSGPLADAYGPVAAFAAAPAAAALAVLLATLPQRLVPSTA
ncbi:MFS transporter [Fodinicola acaciae]|uniref:MFS transporter n=1 Tax=Fodinicola acaciae TaxID=2681555 RepID=UPI0013D333DD|nr:MFS transporter [Fodinicola acaciae]